MRWRCHSFSSSVEELGLAAVVWARGLALAAVAQTELGLAAPWLCCLSFLKKVTELGSALAWWYCLSCHSSVVCPVAELGPAPVVCAVAEPWEAGQELRGGW